MLSWSRLGLAAAVLATLTLTSATAATYTGTGTISGGAQRRDGLGCGWVSFSYTGPMTVVHDTRPSSICPDPPPGYELPAQYDLDFSLRSDLPAFWTDCDSWGESVVGFTSGWEPFNCSAGPDGGLFGGGGGSIGPAGGPLEAVSVHWTRSGGLFSISGQTFSFNGEFSAEFHFSGYSVDTPGGGLSVAMGQSWDGVSLQEILDAEYGPGAIDVETGYEGYLDGDGDPAWWQDLGVGGALVRELAGWANRNTMGWYLDTLGGRPAIDGVDDGVIFEGPATAGAEFLVSFPSSTRFGFYLNPNGDLDATNAPEPETFFTNRFYHDIGPDGSGAVHPPLDGDVQCLIFNITHLRGGVPTYVIAWEDNDSGSPLSAAWSPTTTDNDYNDLVVEISAFSPVKVEEGSWGEIKSRYQD